MWYNPPDGQRRESFHMGDCLDAYNFLGAHPVEEAGKRKWHFSVWAPNAQRVSLVGEFCGWDGEAYPMTKQAKRMRYFHTAENKFSVFCKTIISYLSVSENH